MFIGDVGEDAWEEIDVGAPRANYGWPMVEGPGSRPGVTAPIYHYSHEGSSASVTGGLFLEANSFPPEYHGNYFFGDYAVGFIRRMILNPDGSLKEARDFGPAEGVVDFAQGPDGNLYYLSITTGALRRIRYTGTSNRPPAAVSSANPAQGGIPLAVQFSSAGSSDPEGGALTYAWEFGDGGVSTEANPSHTYTVAGTYRAVLTVTDGLGATGTADPLVINAGNTPPLPTILAPLDESLYNAGDSIGFSGWAEDAEEGRLPPASLRWDALLHHGTHTHPFGTWRGIDSGSFTIPRIGEPSADTWYEIKLTATDSMGGVGVKSIEIRPRKVKLTFLTEPPGLSILLNGQPLGTPAEVESVVGFEHALDAPDVVSGGVTYRWQSWSMAGPRAQTLTTPVSNTTYTATFAP